MKVENESDIESKLFDNSDFGYYKVTIERPKRLKAQFTPERVETLRYDKAIQEPMEYAYITFGDSVYTDIKKHEKELLDWCEKNDINLTAANKKKLISQETWDRHANLLKVAAGFDKFFYGDTVHNDYNVFEAEAMKILKGIKSISAADAKAILGAVSWYDPEAEKVIKKVEKLSGEKLSKLCDHLGCMPDDLADYGYHATGKNNEYIVYDTESDLRDTENVPLKENIHDYFKREVKPHVDEAWINLDATKIGYEVSFNKYFYKHKPLRSLEDVTADILALERESDGLIHEILNLV